MSESPRALVARIIREVLPRRFRDIALDDRMSLHGDLGIDSLGLMSLVFRLEEEFTVDLMEHADRVAAMVTTGDVLRLVADVGGLKEVRTVEFGS